MTRKELALVLLAAALAAVYIVFFTDLFAKKSIQIVRVISTGRPSAIPRDHDSPQVYPVAFQFNGKYPLKSVKVVNAAEFATNKYALPLWHMVSDSNSPPQISILYGTRIPGMKPAIPRSRPKPLEAGVNYLLFIDTGKLKAQTNFTTREYVPLRSVK
jgi:hypothetical protein